MGVVQRTHHAERVRTPMQTRQHQTLRAPRAPLDTHRVECPRAHIHSLRTRAQDNARPYTRATRAHAHAAAAADADRATCVPSPRASTAATSPELSCSTDASIRAVASPVCPTAGTTSAETPFPTRPSTRTSACSFVPTCRSPPPLGAFKERTKRVWAEASVGVGSVRTAALGREKARQPPMLSAPTRTAQPSGQ
eukprot:6200234-Pleurochrysis_carterae.AAC.1